MRAKDVVLRRDFAPGERPTVSLCLILRTVPPSSLLGAAPYLARLGPHVDEVVVTVVDDREFADYLARRPESLSSLNRPVSVVSVCPSEYPHLYADDVPSTFSVGEPLAGESYPDVACEGVRFLKDRSAAASLGWSRCGHDWRLTLFDFSLLRDPENISGACDLLRSHQKDLAYSHHQHLDGRRSLTPIVASNMPHLAWEGSEFECLEGSASPTILEGVLRVDTPEDLRDPRRRRRMFRSLYADARAKDWAVPPVTLLHLARTADLTTMRSFACTAVDTYLDTSLYPEERAWACSLRGEICERSDDFGAASDWHSRSVDEHPASKNNLRLARTRFREGKWSECVKAYEAAVERAGQPHLVDDGPETFNQSLILVASSLHALGRPADARQACQHLRKVFPDNQAVNKLCEEIS